MTRVDKAREIAKWLIVALPVVLPAYLNRFRIGPVPTTALELFLAVIFIAFTVGYGAAGWNQGWKKLGAWQWPIIAWLFASLIACFWAPSIFAGLGLWRAYVLEPLFIFVMLPVLLAGGRERKLFEWSLYALVIWTTLVAMFQFATGSGIPAPWNVSIADGRRATGPFPFPNALALLVVPIGAWAFARKFWPVTIAALVAALLARSQGGVGALLVACWFVLVCDKRWRRWAIAGALIASAAVGLIPQIRDPFIQEITFQSWSGRVRVWMWDETWQMLRDRPITGAGMGGYPMVVAPYHGHDFVEIFQYPHTIIFNFWSETGLLGLIAFGWIVVTWVVSSKQLAVNSSSKAAYCSLLTVCLAPLIAILVHGLVDVPYFKNDLAIAFWMLAFLATFHLDREPKQG